MSRERLDELLEEEGIIGYSYKIMNFVEEAFGLDLENNQWEVTKYKAEVTESFTFYNGQTGTKFKFEVGMKFDVTDCGNGYCLVCVSDELTITLPEKRFFKFFRVEPEETKEMSCFDLEE